MQKNMFGPAGFVAVEDAEALEPIQQRVSEAALEGRSVVKFGGCGTEDGIDHMLSEGAMRGFWKGYCDIMGIEMDVATLEAELRISRRNLGYARCIDENRLEVWVDFFVGEDARYLIHRRENADAGLEGYSMYCRNKPLMRDRVMALRKAHIRNIHYDRHIVGASRVVGVEDDVFKVRTGYCVIQTDVEGRSEVFSAGEYREKVVLTDGEAKFRKKIVVPDTFNIDRPLAVPL